MNLWDWFVSFIYSDEKIHQLEESLQRAQKKIYHLTHNYDDLRESLVKKNDTIMQLSDLRIKLEQRLIEAGVNSHDRRGEYLGVVEMLDELIRERDQLKDQARLLSLRNPLSYQPKKKRGKKP